MSFWFIFYSVIIVANYTRASLLFVPSKYEAIPGYFAQDDPTTSNKELDVNVENFGLLANVSWPQLVEDIETLNAESAENVAYKLFFFARHGEGVHNVAGDFFGSDPWKCYWNIYTSCNETICWNDALLTETGVKQAQTISKSWKKQLSQGAPRPQKFYSSPLRRAADTLVHTWTNITLDRFPFAKPIFKEMLRETYGTHRSDQHHNRTYLEQRYPNFIFESGFADTDELWSQDFREPVEHRNYRAHRFLNDIFANDTSTFVSITAHGGIIDSLLNVTNHLPFSLGTGQMVPVIVRASGTEGKDTTYSPTLTVPWIPKATCKSSYDPLHTLFPATSSASA